VNSTAESEFRVSHLIGILNGCHIEASFFPGWGQKNPSSAQHGLTNVDTYFCMSGFQMAYLHVIQAGGWQLRSLFGDIVLILVVHLDSLKTSNTERPILERYGDYYCNSFHPRSGNNKFRYSSICL